VEAGNVESDISIPILLSHLNMPDLFPPSRVVVRPLSVRDVVQGVSSGGVIETCSEAGLGNVLMEREERSKVR